MGTFLSLGANQSRNTYIYLTHHSKVPSPINNIEGGGKAPSSGGYATRCAGAIQRKAGGIQVLAGVAPSSQTVGSNIRVIHERAKHSL
jgi:hypothetical protein